MCNKVFLLVALNIFCGCQGVPPLEKPPTGDGWITYQQAGSSVVAASGTIHTYNTTVHYTTVNGVVETFEGSFLHSKETPLCEGYSWVQDCNSLFLKKRK